MSRRPLQAEMHFPRHCELRGSRSALSAHFFRYNNLFEWIVGRVNVSMKPPSNPAYVIGVLDI